MFGLGGAEILLIVFLALLLIGPKKIPELARGLGRAMREFQKAKSEFVEENLEEKSMDKARKLKEAPGNED